MINFNHSTITGKESNYMQDALQRGLCGDGYYTKKCNYWLERVTGTSKALVTTSCTHALELAAMLIDIKPGEEVIMPAYTFVSTANAFILRGARIIFVDVNPQTMNIDEKLIEAAITPATKAIVPVHYAGVSCNMDRIMDIASSHNLFVVEDAAQGIMSSYKHHHLGTMGHLGCYSFHETKNITCGEGGALLINDKRFIERAEIIREKGTDRSKFLRGQVDKYTWVDIGSSYLPSELNTAFLYAQLEEADDITKARLSLWNKYYEYLTPLADKGFIELPVIPEDCTHNAHMFYIKTKDIEERSHLIEFMADHEIQSVFHYIPLHSSPAGEKMGRFVGEDIYTTRESERLLRLPMYYGLDYQSIEQVCYWINRFYGHSLSD